MDRKDYLERMQRAACGARTDHELVEYKDHTYYPDAYIMTCDSQGKPVHKARLHDLNANSVQECNLSDVQPKGGETSCPKESHS